MSTAPRGHQPRLLDVGIVGAAPNPLPLPEEFRRGRVERTILCLAAWPYYT